MTIQRRLFVSGLLLVAALAIYGAGRRYSPSLVAYIVEQTLVQKAPPGTDLAYLHDRFHVFLTASPDGRARLEKLLRLSEYLEKRQVLAPEELDDLLQINPGALQHESS